MNFISPEISVAAIVPALILAIYVFLYDRVEKEPVPLLISLFFAGGVAYVPAFFAQRSVISVFDSLFSEYITYNFEGVATYSSNLVKYGHGTLIVFIGVALIEEILKWFAMFIITRKNKNFNCLFDGIVYGAFVSLGFAMVDNIVYAWQSGWDMLLFRTIITLPGHLYFGILMGYCYTMWRVRKSAALAEKEYEKRGLIKITKPFKSGGWFASMIILPVLYHGIYGFAEFFRSNTSDIIFYIINTVCFVLCMAGIRKFSRTDTYRGRYADALLDKKYPETRGVCDDIEEDLDIFDEEDEDEENDAEEDEENGKQ